jgi:hypothetical protein
LSLLFFCLSFFRISTDFNVFNEICFTYFNDSNIGLLRVLITIFKFLGMMKLFPYISKIPSSKSVKNSAKRSRCDSLNTSKFYRTRTPFFFYNVIRFNVLRKAERVIFNFPVVSGNLIPNKISSNPSELNQICFTYNSLTYDDPASFICFGNFVSFIPLSRIIRIGLFFSKNYSKLVNCSICSAVKVTFLLPNSFEMVYYLAILLEFNASCLDYHSN